MLNRHKPVMPDVGLHCAMSLRELPGRIGALARIAGIVRKVMLRAEAQGSLQNEGISPKGTFPSRGIETFGAHPLVLP